MSLRRLTALVPVLGLSLLTLAAAGCGRRDSPRAGASAAATPAATSQARTSSAGERPTTEKVVLATERATSKREATPRPGGGTTAADFARAFAEDDAAAKKAYNGKEVTVEGKVAQVHKAGGTLVLEGYRPKDRAPVEVRCSFPAAEWDRVAAVRPGDRVRVRGRSEGGAADGEVSLVRCALLK